MKDNSIKFEDVEESLKTQFDLLMNHPEQFDITTKNQEKIKSLSEYAKKAGYEMLVQNAKATLAKQNGEELAKSLKKDLEEDGVKISTKTDLEKLLKQPEKDKWKLEPEMIKHIKSMSVEEKNDLKESFADREHIDIETFGHKLLSGLKKLWSKLEPVFEKILGIVGVLVSEIASKEITKKLGDNELSKALSEGTKSAIKSTSDTVKEVLEETTKFNSGHIENQEPEEISILGSSSLNIANEIHENN